MLKSHHSTPKRKQINAPVPTGSNKDFLLSSISNNLTSFEQPYIPKDISKLVSDWISSHIPILEKIDQKSPGFQHLQIIVPVINNLFAVIQQSYSPNTTLPIIPFIDSKLTFLSCQVSLCDPNSSMGIDLPHTSNLHNAIQSNGTGTGTQSKYFLGILQHPPHRMFIDPSRIQILKRDTSITHNVALAFLLSTISTKSPQKIVLSFDPPHPPNTDPFESSFLSYLSSIYHQNLVLFLGYSNVQIDNESKRCHVYEYMDTHITPSVLSDLNTNSKATILLQMANLIQYLCTIQPHQPFTFSLNPENISLSYEYKVSKLLRLFNHPKVISPLSIIWSYPIQDSNAQILTSVHKTHSQKSNGPLDPRFQSSPLFKGMEKLGKHLLFESNIIFSYGTLLYYFFTNGQYPFGLPSTLLHQYPSPTFNAKILYSQIHKYFETLHVPGNIHDLTNRRVIFLVSLSWNYFPEYRPSFSDIQTTLSEILASSPSIEFSQVTTDDPLWRNPTQGISTGNGKDIDQNGHFVGNPRNLQQNTDINTSQTKSKSQSTSTSSTTLDMTESESTIPVVFDSGISSDHTPQQIYSQLQSDYLSGSISPAIAKIEHLLNFFSDYDFVQFHKIIFARHQFENETCQNIDWKNQLKLGVDQQKPLLVLYSAVIQAQSKSPIWTLLEPLESIPYWLLTLNFEYHDPSIKVTVESVSENDNHNTDSTEIDVSLKTSTSTVPDVDDEASAASTPVSDALKIHSIEDEDEDEILSTIGPGSGINANSNSHDNGNGNGNGIDTDNDNTRLASTFTNTNTINLWPLFNDILLPMIDTDRPDPILLTLVGLLFEYQVVTHPQGLKDQADQFFTIASEEQEPIAQLYLGIIARKNKEFDSCAEWITKSAERGSILSQRFLAQIYESIKHIKDLRLSITWYTRASHQNDIYSLLKLGKFSLKGNSVVIQSYNMALKWFTKASQCSGNGRDEAFFQLGNLYKNGKGVKKSLKKAAKYYLAAAELDHVASQYIVGHWFEKGFGVIQNATKALKWYNKAAQANSPKALCRLGVAYKNGALGLERNLEKALAFFHKASDFNFANAQFQIGHCYETGVGVQKDTDLAANWYQQAADHGSPDAFNALMKLESSTDGVDQDFDGLVVQDDVDPSLREVPPLNLSGVGLGNVNSSNKSSVGTSTASTSTDSTSSATSSSKQPKLASKSSFLKRNRSKIKRRKKSSDGNSSNLEISNDNHKQSQTYNQNSRSVAQYSAPTAFLDLIT